MDYAKVLEYYDEISILENMRGLLAWDLETNTIPSKGVEYRGKQLGYISQRVHNIWQNKEFGDLIRRQVDREGYDEVQKRNIELLNRSLITATATPSELVKKLALQANQTNARWKKAKKESNYQIVKNDVSQLFTLVRERAGIIGKEKGIDDPFAALISERDAGFNVDNLTSIFKESKNYLVPTLKKIMDRGEDHNYSFLNTQLERRVEEHITRDIADIYQYDYKTRGRIDEVTHPLTIGCGPDDVRVTVKFGNYSTVISSMQHEIGHGLHSLHRNPEWGTQPVNRYGFPSIAEMASRFTENKIGKSKEFWEYYYPKLQHRTGEKLAGIDLDEFYRGFTNIQPHWSRMTSDEITYGLHIIIRFEVEKGLFEDKISFDEFPQVWNEKYEKYLGVNVANDSQGILQDLHYYSYYWGYFQGYFLGDLLGSQIYYHMDNALPDWKTNLAQGDYSGVHEYFVENIYSKGALYDPLDHVERITGEKFTIDHFKKYIDNRYLNE